LRAEHDLRHAAKGGSRREKGFSPASLPDDVQDGFVVSGIGMVLVRVPIGGTQMNFDMAQGYLAVLLSILREAHHRAGKIGTAPVIPEPRLDDLDRAPIIRRQGGLKQLLKPKRLNLQFRRRRRRILPQQARRLVEGLGESSFHSRNLITRWLES
jgi:hypothetical protein